MMQNNQMRYNNFNLYLEIFFTQYQQIFFNTSQMCIVPSHFCPNRFKHFISFIINLILCSFHNRTYQNRFYEISHLLVTSLQFYYSFKFIYLEIQDGKQFKNYLLECCYKILMQNVNFRRQILENYILSFWSIKFI